MVLVQVPRPNDVAGGLTRVEAVALALGAMPGVAASRRLSPADIAALLKPWLGEDPRKLSLPLPAVFEVTLVQQEGGTADVAQLDASVTAAAPGSLVERNGAWMTRLSALVRSLQACAALALLVVAFVATAVVTVATRAGLSARRDAVEIVHGLGATDALIARLFAARVTVLVLAGAVLGLLLAIPVLLSLARLAAPFQPGVVISPRNPAALLAALPPVLWGGLALLPLVAAAIGWLTAQATVRGWLARLP
jgi:cell division transport system permease protein